MKIFPKILMICNILVLASLNLKAQNKDYVITIRGDTLACTITTPAFVPNGKYKTAQMNRPREISENEIKEYYISKDRILYREVLKRPGKAASALFMVVLESGKINLYDETTNTTYMNSGPYGGVSSSSSTVWYISKGSDTIKPIKNSDFSISSVFFKSRKTRENVFAGMIMDNKEVYDKYLADDKFSFKQVRYLVHLYNTGKPFGSDAGQDYVITKNKDTIFCEIEPGTFNTVSRYRVTPKDKFIKIDTAITAYFLYKDSSTFLLKTLPNDKHPQFVKYLVKGKINLYAYSLNNAAADGEASLYACKENGNLVLIKDEFHRPGKSEKKAFTDLISDDSTLAEKFANLPYNFMSVLNYVQMYDSDYLNNKKPAN
jgi:hypothetical protein